MVIITSGYAKVLKIYVKSVKQVLKVGFTFYEVEYQDNLEYKPLLLVNLCTI